MKLCRYLYGSMEIRPAASTARPSAKSSMPSHATKKSTKQTAAGIIRRRARSWMVLSSMLFMKYWQASVAARNVTAMPRKTFETSVSASSPCHGVVHCEITVALPLPAPLARLRRSTVKFAPVKSVPTAVPSSSGPAMPLIIRNTLNVFSPKTLPGLRRYS